MQIENVDFNADVLEILDEVKRQLDERHIKMLAKYKNGPTDVQVCCPYHNEGQERRPSAGIRKSDGQFHCFACGEVHTLPEVISAYFKRDEISGAWGWKWLLQNFASVEIEERKPIELDLSRNRRVKDVEVYVSEEELDNYRYFHPYMYDRKMTDEVIELFDIGYDKKTKCITFPVRDVYGHTLFIARRSVKSKFFNYPSGVEKPVYGLYELYKVSPLNDEPFFPEDIIICESMIDALTCWAYGRHAVALNGLGNELQFKQLRQLPCRHYILGTDNDKAGQEARKRIRKNLYNKIVTEYVLPDDRKDINELSRQEFDALKEIF